eukprot:31323-Pelagococcus_subviridis.AAC.10
MRAAIASPAVPRALWRSTPKRVSHRVKNAAPSRRGRAGRFHRAADSSSKDGGTTARLRAVASFSPEGDTDYVDLPVANRRAELMKMTMAQIKPMLRGAGLKLGGKKPECVDRLLEHEFGTSDDEADVDPAEDVVGLAKEWRRGRVVSGGVTLGDIDAVDSALRSAGFDTIAPSGGGGKGWIDEAAADAAFGGGASFTDTSTKFEAYESHEGGAAQSAAARLMGKSDGAFDDGGGSGWDDGRSAGADEWEYSDAYAAAPRAPSEGTTPQTPQTPPKVDVKAEKLAKQRAERRRLAKRSAIVTALRQLATERDGFEADPRVHLEAVSRAIDVSYRKLKHSKFARMNANGRDVCVDINVSEGTLLVLAQRIGRSGAVEYEEDDTEAFLEAYGKRHMMRKLAYAFTDELSECVAATAANSYRVRTGEMVEATVVSEGRRGEYLLKLDDGAFACLPAEEGIPEKRYGQGDRVSALVLGVEDQTWAADRRAPVVVSTAIAGLLAEVLKKEVPEVATGDVVIRSVARVSGKMSKVAVSRRDGAVGTWDPVLACVGENNSRMLAIRERLGGETCQILTWSDVQEEMVAEALFPAQVVRVDKALEEADEHGGKEFAMDKYVAYVNQFDEAKAIGAGGINVKLAAALCGCFILIERYEPGNAHERRGGGEFRGDGGRGGGGWDDAEEDVDAFKMPYPDDDDDDDDDYLSDLSNLNRRTRSINLESDGLDELGWPTDRADPKTPPPREETAFSRYRTGGDVELDDLGWPDLDPPSAAPRVDPDRGRFDDLIADELIADDDEFGFDFLRDAEGALDRDAEERGVFDDDVAVPRDAADDPANWEEVGPGKVGAVMFGSNLRAGITGACTFMGDPEPTEGAGAADFLDDEFIPNETRTFGDDADEDGELGYDDEDLW